MKFINKMRKKTKGFTLVEIIVVLVILAILAAFTIPTMLGFVSDAKSKALIAQAREVYVAAQAAGTEFSLGTNSELINSATLATAANVDVATKQMRKYLKNDLTAVSTGAAATGAAATGADNAFWTVKITDGKVDSLTFIKEGHQLKLNAGGTVEVIS
ncbi:type II secretion system protein [Acetobacterium bakii]|nr:type II secretion system protein [Acetobacterium bakii]